MQKSSVFVWGNPVQGKVVSVQWSIGMKGIAFPVVCIEPVQVNGRTVTKVSGVCAKFIFSNRIGPGAIITFAYTGYEMPDVMSVVKQAEAQAPIELMHMLEWGPGGIDLRVRNNLPANFHDNIEVARVTKFCFDLKWAGWTQDIIKTAVQAKPGANPYWNGHLRRILGLCSVNSKWIRDNVKLLDPELSLELITGRNNALRDASELQLALASNIFGSNFNLMALESLLTEHPNWDELYRLGLTKAKEKGYAMEVVRDLAVKAKGVSPLLATQFAERLGTWLAFRDELLRHI